VELLRLVRPVQHRLFGHLLLLFYWIIF